MSRQSKIIFTNEEYEELIMLTQDALSDLTMLESSYYNAEIQGKLMRVLNILNDEYERGKI